MNKAILVFLFASSLAAQVQIGKNVQIGAAGTTGGSTVGTSGQLQMTDGSGGHAASSVTDDGTNVTSTKPLVVNASGNGIKSTEGTAPSGVASSDLLYPDSTDHRWKMNNNNGGATAVVGYADWGGTPALAANTNLVLAGDSRFATGVVGAGQSYADYIVTQTQFTSSRMNFFDGAVPGATCSSMTSAYAANVQPHKPAGAITTAYLFIEVGINDISASTAIGTIQGCYSAYLAAAVADGFTPVIHTVYYWNAATATQEAERIALNGWLKTNFPSYFVIDVDGLFPASNSSIYYFDAIHLNGLGNQAWAKATNFLWGLGKSGTQYASDYAEHDRFTPPSGAINVDGGVNVSGIYTSGTTVINNLGGTGYDITSNKAGFGSTQSLVYSSINNCASTASPAVCGSSAAGSIQIPTGTNPTLTVNTNVVTANSQIFFEPDSSLGTRLSTTCNSTAATLAGGHFISARTGATSFTITFVGTVSTNGVCGNFFVIN
jgi:lysophospholipase L1-like esterase